MGNRTYSKIFQGVFSVVNRFMPHRQPQLVCGKGSVQQIPNILKGNGIKCPMIVTGARIGKSEAVLKLMENLPASFLYAEVKPDPPASQITEMARLYKENKCDGIVAIGGGSNMDAAKAMGAIVVRPNKTIQDLDGVLKVRKEIPFFVAVPTTSGTGSECTIAAVVTDDTIGRKYAVADPVLCPNVAVLDAELTMSMPPSLTAYTGMDALTHAVETYLNSLYHINDVREKAESAIRDIFTYLPKAYQDGNDLEAREKMLLASYNAGIAFTVAGVGYVHAIAHTFGGQYHIQHGLANAVILPYVLEAYRPAANDALAHLCDLISIDCNGDANRKASAFIDAIRKMNTMMEIPDKFGVLQEDNLEKMITWADKEANPLYPCPVFFTREHFAKIMRAVG